MNIGIPNLKETASAVLIKLSTLMNIILSIKLLNLSGRRQKLPQLQPLKEFRVFRDLPPELRMTVWKFSKPRPRLVQYESSDPCLGAPFRLSEPLDPRLIFTCKESYNACFRGYRWFPPVGLHFSFFIHFEQRYPFDDFNCEEVRYLHLVESYDKVRTGVALDRKEHKVMGKVLMDPSIDILNVYIHEVCIMSRMQPAALRGLRFIRVEVPRCIFGFNRLYGTMEDVPNYQHMNLYHADEFWNLMDLFLACEDLESLELHFNMDSRVTESEVKELSQYLNRINYLQRIKDHWDVFDPSTQQYRYAGRNATAPQWGRGPSERLHVYYPPTDQGIAK